MGDFYAELDAPADTGDLRERFEGFASACGWATKRPTAERLAQVEAVPNAPLRERFLTLYEAGALTLSSLCERAGIMRVQRDRDRRTPDTSYALRALGLIPQGGGRGGARLRTHVPYELAVRLADALGMDPHEAGV